MSTSSSPARARIEPATFSYQEVSLSGISENPAASAEREQKLRDEARAAGLREGEARTRAAYVSELQQMRQDLAAALKEFAHQRTQYFSDVEREVVQLAVAIARRILHREAQIDPHLLAGMARVALETVRDTGKITLRVHSQQVSDFRIFFAQEMPEDPPEVIEDAKLNVDRCILETSLGKTEIGPEIQLKEIEQGLFDLQAARPR